MELLLIPMSLIFNHETLTTKNTKSAKIFKSIKNLRALRVLRVLRGLINLLLFFGLTASALPAQTTTGTLIGTIIDEKRAPIAGVLVRVINSANGFSTGKRSNAEGVYRIDF